MQPYARPQPAARASTCLCKLACKFRGCSSTHNRVDCQLAQGRRRGGGRRGPYAEGPALAALPMAVPERMPILVTRTCRCGQRTDDAKAFADCARKRFAPRLTSTNTAPNLYTQGWGYNCEGHLCSAWTRHADERGSDEAHADGEEDAGKQELHLGKRCRHFMSKVIQNGRDEPSVTQAQGVIGDGCGRRKPMRKDSALSRSFARQWCSVLGEIHRQVSVGSGWHLVGCHPGQGENRVMRPYDFLSANRGMPCTSGIQRGAEVFGTLSTRAMMA